MLVLAKLRARAGTLLGDEVADVIERLAKKGRELSNFFDQRVEQIRVGETIVRLWPNQAWVERVKESLIAVPDPNARDDRYTREF